MSTQPFGRAPDGHLDIEAVSDLIEGLLSADQTASVEEHLDHCEACRDVRDALAEIQGTLDPEIAKPADLAGQRDEGILHVDGDRSLAFRSAPRETTTSSGDVPRPSRPSSAPGRHSQEAGKSNPPRTLAVIIMIAAIVVVAAIVTLVMAAR